jgi:hypothetical protein
MPTIPIPLRSGDPDVFLDLKTVIDRLYDGGGYHYFSYSDLPEPRLSPADAAWAATFVPTTT